MVYDQGFIIDTIFARFIANFKYTVKPNNIENVTDLGVSTYALFDNYCNETMVGTVLYTS